MSTHRPVNMHSQQRVVERASVGDFVFVKDAISSDVRAGTVVSVADDAVVIHEHRQAPVQAKRFTPLYSTASGVITQRVKVTPDFSPVHRRVERANILAVGTINNFFIDQALLEFLRSIGVVDQQ